ncbi:hypothetical protein [Streptomyces sp. NPDC015345]|uniref:hypothetical protein n=1 Tax=Streptomyces sp. NPDC015345 TaxID=3364953 RepID=UPI0037017326
MDPPAKAPAPPDETATDPGRPPHGTGQTDPTHPGHPTNPAHPAHPNQAHARLAHRLLLAVCCAFALLSCVLVPLTLPLGWDELVYASRYSPYAPATPFSAPRTRGVPFLIAPVATWSDSTVLLRVWLTLLAAAALYLGFRPWLRAAHRPWAAPVAAALYGSLWITLFYANSAMPNHYTAMGAVGAVGLFLWPRQSLLTCTGIAAGIALATLMRPNDGFAIGLPLLVAALLVPAWRGRSRVLAVLAGLAAGALPWAVEAYIRFGGVRERLTEASEVQGDLRPLLSFVHHLTVIDGPLLCRPCDNDSVRPVAAEWWLLLTLLVVAGLWTLRRAGSRPTPRQASAPPAPTAAPAGPLRDALLALVTGLAIALPYFVLVPYATPRFLLPTHALFAPTAAIGLLTLLRLARAARPRWAGVAVPALVLGGHLAVQAALAHGNATIQGEARRDWVRVAETLERHGVGNGPGPGAGTGTPCLLNGNTSVIPLAHTAGCAPGGGLDDPRRPTALVMRGAAPPEWARDWPSHTVPGTYVRGWVIHVRP